jgi:hypothetical protein
MDADEREIYYFLKPRMKIFISSREICRHAGGKIKFKAEPDWAKPVLARMVERGILDSDAAGHYRLKPPPNATVMQRWVSPQIANILRNRSKEMGEIVISEDELDNYYDRL